MGALKIQYNSQTNLRVVYKATQNYRKKNTLQENSNTINTSKGAASTPYGYSGYAYPYSFYSY